MILHHHTIVRLQLLGQYFQNGTFFWNCCSDFPITNAPFLESTEKFDRFVPASLQKTKFHIFQNIYKMLIHGLRPLKYKNMCELCDIILDKDKKGRIMVNKCFVLHQEVIYFFHEKCYIIEIQ